MDKLTAVEADLTKAREALTALQDELPQFHALLTDNEQDAQRLKSERASLDAQAQAKGRVNVAREMLEQHQSDIATARAEVARLEALERRELTLAKMATPAQRTTKHRKALEKTVHEASAVLGQALEQIAEAVAGIREERQAFALQGRELAPEFDGLVPFNNSIQEGQKKAVCEGVLSELEARGADLTDVLNSATGKHTRLDRSTRLLPNPEYANLLWRAVSETVAKRDRQAFYGVPLPLKPEPISLLATASSDPYSI